MLILWLILCALPAFSQDFKGGPYDKRIFSVNPSIVFSGDGDIWGFGGEVSHLKTIGKHWYLRQNLASWIVNGSSWIDGAFENQTGMDLSAEIGFSPFKMDRRILSVSGGICAAYMINTSPVGGGTYSVANPSGDENMSYMNYYMQGFEKGADLGICFGISYHTQLSPVFYLNTKAEFRSHFIRGSALSMISVGIGFDTKHLFK